MGHERESLFEQCARKHYEGTTSIGEFCRQTRQVLERVAARLMQRWKAPPSVDLDDVVQEMLIGCIWAFKRFDPNHPKCGSVEGFVMYNACDKAKKWLHRQRGAIRHGNADANPSRYAILFHDVADKRSRGEDVGEIEWVAEALQADAEQHDELERREVWRSRLKTAPTVRLRWGIMALESARGERSTAAKRLYANAQLRFKLRLGGEHDARKIIAETVKYLAVA